MKKAKQITDAERLEWCLRYGFAKSLGTVEDWEYHPITRKLIDRAIQRGNAQGKRLTTPNR